MSETEQIRDVYQIITGKIIEQLEQGTVPWQKSWAGAGMPQNLLTKKPYRGINTFLLASLNYETNLFLTFDQAKSINASIRKGEHSHIVVFWKWPERKKEETQEEKERKRKPMLRYYRVFNIAQCDNIPEKYIPLKVEGREHRPIDVCEEIIHFMPNRPDIVNKEAQPFYHVVKDFINMPFKDSFINPESYYDTLFHELIHSTGHVSRLDRKELMDIEKGEEGFSLEELTAEIGACFLNSHAGIDTPVFSNNVAYIKGWLKRLNNDKRFIFFASSKAQRAVDYILDKQNTPENRETEEEEIIQELEDISDIL
jgi:antirestriction protein ArdC